MSRRSTFVADAEAVQGNKGATVTFRAVTIDGWKEHVADPNTTDKDLLVAHVLDWSGIVDDDDHELPIPAEEPGIVGKLYLAEVRSLARLLYTGAPAIPVKN